MLKTLAIKKFLNDQPYDMGKLYTSEMEVQVNVARDDGEPIQGSYAGLRWQGFTDGLQTWKHFRIPWKADSDPEYLDREILFDISEHAEAIGLTGWNWVQQRSIWVGYDFDSLVGHQAGLTSADLKEIQRKMEDVPFVTIYSSTSGLGLHVYVFLSESPEVPTHTHHAAVARAILNKLSALTGLELSAKVDTLGGNLWVWHRKAVEDQSLQLLHQGEKLDKVPENWEQYVSVGRANRRSRAVSGAVTEAQLVAARNKLTLDDEHIKLLQWFEKSSALWWWDDQKQLLVCHTADLKRAHGLLQMRGIFETIATGKDHGQDQNCFCFPTPHGGWSVRRHSRGTREHESWFTDNSGWTTTYFNKLPNLRTASTVVGGVESDKDISFKTGDALRRALFLMGAELDIPAIFNQRPSSIRRLAENRILVRVKAEDYDRVDGWLEKKGNWEKLHFLPQVIDDEETPDNLLRHTTRNNVEDGWWVATNHNWIMEGKTNVSNLLACHGYGRHDIDLLMGRCVMNNWRVVSRPFEPEYPGNREWNKDAAQFNYDPERGRHKTWDLILEHCGKGLNDVLLQDTWAKDNGIINGLLYLQAWIASLVQFPQEPTPYLFFAGPQNSGKSVFHESLSLLFQPGYCRADQALTNSSGFNGELANAVLCVVEETNLSKRGWASDRIKDWVTGKTISIHPKGRTPYSLPNCTHWIQCANDSDYCPILPGDTRITMVTVGLPEQEIPKSDLLARCEAEASAFLWTVLNFELPETTGRLRLPVIETEDKRNQMEYNQSAYEAFENEFVHPCPGAVIKFSELYQKFMDTLNGAEKLEWTHRRMSKELSYPKGMWGGGGHIYVGNCSWEKDKEPVGKPLRVERRRLM